MAKVTGRFAGLRGGQWKFPPFFLAQLDYTWSGTCKRSGNYTTISRHIIRLCPKTLYLQHFHAMFFHPTLAPLSICFLPPVRLRPSDRNCQMIQCRSTNLENPEIEHVQFSGAVFFVFAHLKVYLEFFLVESSTPFVKQQYRPNPKVFQSKGLEMTCLYPNLHNGIAERVPGSEHVGYGKDRHGPLRIW